MDSPPRGGHDETGLSHLPKRQKTFHHHDLPAARRKIYTVAWICALSIEMAAARAVLDTIHEPLPALADDSNTYVFGNVQGHNIVIACLPTDQYGIVNAANVATNIKRTFPAIRVGLMVGIGGGVPSQVDVRLGDIVVGTRVMQTDLGKVIHEDHWQQLERTAIPRIPHQSLGTAVTALRAKHEFEPSRIPSILQQKFEGCQFGYPVSPDRLFQADYHHKGPNPNCDECDHSKLVLRSTRVSKDPSIHYGAIASGSQVIKNSLFRDKVARQLNVICFEMEAAGLMDIIPCLPIRGICDYSDSHKSKEWQKYAAATAAAYAKELLEGLPVTEIDKEKIHIPTTPDHIDRITQPEDQRRRILKSLRFAQMDDRRSNVRMAHQKTCQWFLSHPDYKAWLDPENLTHLGFLWISGKPGAGKSTIMKFILSKQAGLKNVVTASFFFNARGEALERSVIGMYRSLLLQLLDGFPDLQMVLDDPRLVPTQDEKVCLPLDVLKDLLQKAVDFLGQRSFTCLIDALDECDEQQVRDMIQYFEQLAESSAAERLRICFSSRHYPYIIIRYGTRITLEHQPGHAEDLQAYIRDELRTEDPHIVQNVFQKSAGVLMWVVLVVEILNRELERGAMSLGRKLEELPSGLSDLFKQLLRRDDENMEGLLLCFLWILCAERPLKPEEFYHAIWSGLSLKSPSLVDTKIPDALVQDTINGLPRSHRYVISCSKGLAEITTSYWGSSVQFIHESVRDFLIKDRGLYELWPELGLDWESPSHDRLKDCCNAYMNHTEVCELVSKSSLRNYPTLLSERREILTKYPFLEYVGQSTLYHANAAAKVLPQSDFLSSFHSNNWIYINNLFDIYQARSYSTFSGWMLLSLALRNDHDDLARNLIEQGADINFTDPDGLTPLLRASEGGHKAIATLLIEQGADVNATGKSGWMPLSLALKNDYDDLARILIEQGADSNFTDPDGLTPLLRASDGGYKAIATLLIEQGANVNATGKSGWMPLSLALKNDYDDLARILIEQGADSNITDPDGPTPLLRAVARGYETLTKLLIEQGADVSICDNINGRSPLLRALGGGYKSIASNLIKQGADVNASDKSGWMPLSLALRNGYDTLARILIEQGAYINATDPDGRTPLSRAAASGYETVAKHLIERGADVNASDKSGWMPLSLALRNGYDTLARILIEQGAYINATDPDGRTPLSRAAASGYETVAKHLIERGADVNLCDDMTGTSPLKWALRQGHEELAKLLLDQGARAEP
ncbi:hypothetical protein N7533_007879 [Penicillium manginii]|uniref:uncharacterized protein n=1 Tax=Penicillium manginii TaxID=203109 RepID=UPI002547A81A|nr:uncharacterized protein N7533_007879 [Penicillium manginii]KAJ5750851.1 hypothetical protein N7533_007879 [Penicillium manginii]